jgi:hypothetical protein
VPYFVQLQAAAEQRQGAQLQSTQPQPVLLVSWFVVQPQAAWSTLVMLSVVVIVVSPF